MNSQDKKFIGYRCGQLVVVKRGHSVGKNLRWKCKCECGRVCFHTKQNILKGTLRSCGCFKKKCRGNIHKNWKGSGKVSASFLSRIKSIAKRRGIPFNLSVGCLDEICKKQNGKCALTGTILTFPTTHKDGEKKNSYNASLDRKNSFEGYTKENVQWVTKEVNMMKQQMNEKDFVETCLSVVKFKKNK